MAVSYKKLWKLLIDRDMKKKDLQAKAYISWTTITKMSKNQKVSLWQSLSLILIGRS